MRPHFRAALFLTAASLLAAPRLQASGYNVILIGWDTLRADHVGALGYGRSTTPNLDAFAGKSVLFANAISPASWTLPAFMSVFTSLYPSEHGITNKNLLPAGAGEELPEAVLSTAAATLPQALKAEGYRTAAFTGGAGVGGRFGFSRGFDVYSDSVNFAGFESTFPQALAWLRENRDSKFFIFVHGYDTHPFHDLEKGTGFDFIPDAQAAAAMKIRERHEKMRVERLYGRTLSYTEGDIRLWTDVYDEKIARADRLLGGFLKEFSALGGVEKNTVIVLLSDHGEELFDHGGIDHGLTLYDEVIHVPLLIRVPGGRGRIIKSQVSTLDLFPTLIDLLPLNSAKDLRERLSGSSLAGRMRGEEKPLDAFSETEYLFTASKKAVRKNSGLKLIRDGFTGESELYDVAADPSEKSDLFRKESAGAYRLEMELFNWEDRLERRGLP